MGELIGSLFAGRYRLERKLGTGGMAIVYYGRHEVLGRGLAIKVIHRRLMDDAVVQSFFQREARAASRIEHPNVTYIFDFGYAEDKRPYLAMEYVEGPTLAELVAKGPLATKRALPILLQIAGGLAAAHRENIVHRDLKPHNIVLTKHRGQSDVVKILDFGLAKLTEVDGSESISMSSGKEYGTPQYMSPEQCQGESVDARADIYSFGVLAYEVLTARLPFTGPMAKVLWMHINEPRPRVSERVDVPAPVDDLIVRCMQQAPGERFADGDELFTALEAIVGALQGSAGGGASGAAPSLGREARGTLKMTMVALNTEGGLTLRDGAQLLGHDRWAALDELAYMLRDRNLGSPLISEALARKVAAEDRVLELEAEIDLLRGEEVHIEMRAREREIRLRRAMVQLQHEQEAHASAEPRVLRPTKTAPASHTLRFGSADIRGPRFETRSHELAETIGEILLARDQRLVAIERHIRAREREIEHIQKDIDERRQRLIDLIKPLKGGPAFRSEPELQMRFLLAGL
ncbi:MAG: protein kinase [Myxococcales bacterium]|nr:protein kinase [Myxococcales bacterium]